MLLSLFGFFLSKLKTPWLLSSFFTASQLLKMPLLLLLLFYFGISFSTSPFILIRTKWYRVGDHREFPWIGQEASQEIIIMNNCGVLIMSQVLCWTIYIHPLVFKILLWINYYYPYFKRMQSFRASKWIHRTVIRSVQYQNLCF